MVRGEPAQAIEVLEQSVASFRKMGFAGELGMALGGLALAQHLLKQEVHAKDALQESLGIAVETHGRFTLLNPAGCPGSDCWQMLAGGSKLWRLIQP